MSIIITSGEYATNHSLWYDHIYLGNDDTLTNHGTHKGGHDEYVGGWFIYKDWKYSHYLLNFDDEGGGDNLVYFKEQIC